MMCSITYSEDEDVPLMYTEFVYLVFTRMPGESYCRRLRSLAFCLCYIFRALIYPLCVDSVLKVLLVINQPLAPLLLVVGGMATSGFSRTKLILTLWLAEVFW